MIIKPVKVIGSIVTLFLAAMALASCTGSVVCTTPSFARTGGHGSQRLWRPRVRCRRDGDGWEVFCKASRAARRLRGSCVQILRPLRSPRQLHRARASGLLKQDHLEHCCESPGSVLPGGNPADHGAVLIDSIEDLVLRLGSPEGEGSASAQFGNHAGQSSRCWVHRYRQGPPVPIRMSSVWSACPL